MNGRAFLRVSTQYENVGDALIVRELVSLLVERMVTVVDLSSCPPSFRTTLTLPDNPRLSSYVAFGTIRLFFALLLSRLRGRPTYLFLVPGGRGGEITQSAQVRAVGPTAAYWLIKLIGVSIVQIGVSYDRLGQRHSKVLRQRVYTYAAHFVRDNLSYEHLVSQAIRVDGIMPDLALNRFRSPASSSESRSTIAFSFRSDKYVDRRADIEKAIRRICTDASHEDGLVFVSQVNRDSEYMRSLARLVGGTVRSPVRYVDTSDSIERALREYTSCSWVVSNRLHALLMGMSVGASPLALVEPSVDAKIVGVFRSLGLGAYLVQLGDELVFPNPLGPDEWDRIARHSAELRRLVDDILALDAPRCSAK